MTADRLHGTRAALAIEHLLARGRRGERAGAATDGRKLGLVVEGGAMRGVFSAGVDVGLEELGLTAVFDEVYGTSAGAINAAYFLAGQAAYGATIYYEDINNSRFINFARLTRMLDVDFLFDQILARRKALDVERVLASPSRFFISLADAATGEGFLVPARKDDPPLMEALKASAAHPMLYDRHVRIRDRECFDGGFANPLPVQNAIDAGCTDVLVILTRPSSYVEPPPGFIVRRLFVWKCARGNQRLIETGLRLHLLANAARDMALGRRRPPDGVNIATICPDESGPAVARTTKDARALRAVSLRGARKALQAFGADPDRLVEVLRYFPSSAP
jgi:predicted patatin/cPLA2 family phospholipase